MNHREIAALMAEIAPVIHDYVASGLKGLGERIAAVEARAPIAGERGADGSPGLDGKDGAPGRDGVDGKDGTPGRDGSDGVPGLDGKDGAPGREGVDGKDGTAGIDGKDGAAGIDGKDGRDGVDGKDGADGLNGKDGADGLNGKDGAPGRDGRDASDLGVIKQFVADEIQKSLAATLKTFQAATDDGGRTLTFSFAVDEAVVAQQVTTAFPLDRKQWRVGEYKAGDGVTHGGSFWIAQKDTETTPDTVGGSDWRLAVKRGRDGKEGRVGERGLTGAKGDVGDRGQPGYRG